MGSTARKPLRSGFARLVEDGSVKMKAEDVLKLLEKHEEECNRRYADIQSQLDKLDRRLWGIAGLIIAAAIAQRMF
jgi:chaperonin cofactor prefoldin